MYFPRFLVGATFTLLVVVGWVYYATDSIWRTIGWAVFVATILQVGYFAAVGLMIYLGVSKRAEKIESSTGDESGSLPIRRDGISL
ncbi:hypothetical protein [Mesorhizobium sp. 113-3-3]|uniref:hypothetical protein n=1 Tax=Mesorhizobium sp. 113-3-3 TaxID=2744516 RepID=UPI0018EBAF79|nr:hypothetical protein [Mesorhizobium sp. 113-3-3]BCG83480.1 hypothetical protein MesoLj113b_70220 [Mesorhizobium sp. 113-3-3]